MMEDDPRKRMGTMPTGGDSVLGELPEETTERPATGQEALEGDMQDKLDGEDEDVSEAVAGMDDETALDEEAEDDEEDGGSAPLSPPDRPKGYE